MTTVQENVDLQYVNNFANTKAAQEAPYFINARGDNQYIWVYGSSGFLTGAYYGAIIGVGAAIQARKVSRIPKYALNLGALYGGFHALSAYFRNEI